MLTLGQQYNAGEKPTVILYCTYVHTYAILYRTPAPVLVCIVKSEYSMENEQADAERGG